MRSVVLLVVGACSFGVPAAGGVDRDASIDAVVAPACFQTRCRRITITVDHTKVTGGPHAAFPLHVDVTDPSLARDAVFTTADGASVLPFEREALRLGHLIAWVQLPAVSSTTDTTLQLYFGDPAAADLAAPAATWDAGFQAVWHLTEQTGGAIMDSTSHGNVGTDLGGLALGVGAKLGRGISFDGVDDCLRIPQSASVASTAALATLSVWINWTQPEPSPSQRVLMSSNTFAGDLSGMEWGSNGIGQHYYYPSLAGNSNYVAIQPPFIPGSWHHLALTQDFSTRTVRIFVDGIARTTTSDNLANEWMSLANSADWYWGGVPPYANFAGMMDEIRVSNVVRSAGWIATEYANQSSPSTFYRATMSAP